MLDKVLEFTRAIFEELDPRAFQRRFLELLLSTQNVDRGSLWVRRGDKVVCIEAAGEDSERVLGAEIPADRPSIVGWVIGNARMTVAEPGKDPRHYKEMEQGFAAKSTLILCYPLLLSEGGVYGAVELIDTAARGSRLNLRADYLELLEALVAVGAVALGQALAFDRKDRECRGLRSALGVLRAQAPIVGQSPALAQAMKTARSYARTSFPVLITGESGTGKELAAQVIHQQSQRRHGPFCVQNCSAIPETLLESELFGYRKGAFTGADKDKTGLFEAADGGTVFLDEVGDMAPALQAKVLRLLQNSEVKPLGSPAVRTVDVRIIAATNRDLVKAMEEGNFREDLFYRLNVLPLHMPPLRERPQDIVPLLEYFIRRDCGRLGVERKRLSPEALERLTAHPWKGNVREMENLVKYLLTVVEGDTVDVADLPPHVAQAPGTSACGGDAHGTGQGGAPRGAVQAPASVADLAGDAPVVSVTTVTGQAQPSADGHGLTGYTWDALEQAYARQLLDKTRWNITKAARMAGVNRSTFDSRLKRLGIAKDV